MAEDRFFINVTTRGLTVHMHRGATEACLAGVKRIPAEERDMGRDGMVEIYNNKPYRLNVCLFCSRRYQQILENEDGF